MAEPTKARSLTELAALTAANRRLEAENARLVEQQTATSEILRVISSTQTALEPVFDTIVRNAGRVCDAVDAVIVLADNAETVVAAHWGPIGAVPLGTRRPLTRGTVMGRAIVDAAPIHVEDVSIAPEFPEGQELASRFGHRTTLAVPLLQRSRALGSILVRRIEVRPFSNEQIATLQTFANQAVIAMENVRLFAELRQNNEALTRAHAQVTESLEQQTATSEILRVISSSPADTQPVFDAIAANAARLCSANDAQVLRVEGDVLRLVAAFGAPSMPPVRRLTRGHLVGRAVIDRQTIHVRDLAQALAEYPETTAARFAVQSALAVPLMRDGTALGVIRISRTEVRPFTEKQIALVQTFADQAVIAIENVRLFTELQERTAQLQIANRHKDEFLANMSHELRTPLNSIIGFSEVILERIFGDLTEKQEEYLNDILDLSKIEAGKMELELSEFDVTAAIDNALTLMRERATRRGQIIERVVDASVGTVSADERKVKQVLLNLLSNAVKFTPDGGGIRVEARLDSEGVAIAVTDTGVGIAAEHRELVFEEFEQVGKADKKAEGTGLGLALCKKFVELHGGRIWVQSQLGQGSTFTFTLPASRRE